MNFKNLIYLLKKKCDKITASIGKAAPAVLVSWKRKYTHRKGKRNFYHCSSTDQFIKECGDYPNALRSPDGTVRALPIGDETAHNTIDSQLWINQKWLDKLNLDMPQTPEEFKEVLIAFRDKDPNGNGIQDEIPFTFQDAWGWGNAIENVFGAWGVLENNYHVFTKDGYV